MEPVMILGLVGGLVGLIVGLGAVASVFQIASATKATAAELERQTELLQAQNDMLKKVVAK